MRDWSAAAQIAMLNWLSDVVQDQPNPVNEIELRRVRKRGAGAAVRGCLPETRAQSPIKFH